jgi:hypothetical protein
LTLPDEVLDVGALEEAHAARCSEGTKTPLSMQNAHHVSRKAEHRRCIAHSQKVEIRHSTRIRHSSLLEPRTLAYWQSAQLATGLAHEPVSSAARMTRCADRFAAIGGLRRRDSVWITGLP